MGSILTDIEQSYKSMCCGSPNQDESEIATEIAENTSLIQLSHDIDSIESTESHYDSGIIDDTYTHKTPSYEPSPVMSVISDKDDEEHNYIKTEENTMDFVDESTHSENTLISDRIIGYDLSFTPSFSVQQKPTTNTTKRISSLAPISSILNTFVDDKWNYRELLGLVTFYESNNGIWDNLMFDEILSERHNDYNECIDKLTEIESLKEKQNEYIDDAQELWKEIQHEKRQLLRSESSKLVLHENIFKNMKEETLIFFLRGNKKCLHLSRINSDEMKMSGYIVGGDIVNDKVITKQINDDIKRVYYSDDNTEYMLNIADIDSENGKIGIFAYNLDSFEYGLLAKFPDFDDDIDNMYFSLYYDDKMKELHILCGPKTDDLVLGHVWCILDINHGQNAVDYVSLKVKHAPIIIVCNGEKFIFNNEMIMKYDYNEARFISMNVPSGYNKNTMNYMNYNIVYVEIEKRIYVFGSLLNDILYMNIDDNKWSEYEYEYEYNNNDEYDYKSIQSVLCFEWIILIFKQSDDYEYIHYDTVYCLDLKQNKMVKADCRLIGFERDIVVTKNNIIHCMTQKAHCEINALELIPDLILDFYRKRNTHLVCGYLRRYCVQYRHALSLTLKKIFYHYLPVL